MARGYARVKIHCAAFLQRRLLKYSDQIPGAYVAVPWCACESLPNCLPSPPSTTGTPCSLPHLGHAPLQSAPSPLGCIAALLPHQSDATWLQSLLGPQISGVFLEGVCTISLRSNTKQSFVLMCEDELQWLFFLSVYMHFVLFLLNCQFWKVSQ